MSGKEIETENEDTNSVSANISDLISEHSVSFPEKLNDLDLSNKSIVSLDSDNHSNKGSIGKSGEGSEKTVTEKPKVSFKDLFKQCTVKTVSATDNQNLKANDIVSVSDTQKRKASESPKSAHKTVKKPATAPNPPEARNVITATASTSAAMPMPRAAASARPRYNLLLKNRYSVLSDESDDADDTDTPGPSDRNHRATSPKKQQVQKQMPPSAIIIPGTVTNHSELVHRIQATVSHGFDIKYTRNNLNIFLEDKDDKTKFLENLKDVQYHTYTDNAEKTHAFVLRGLDNAPTTDEIKSELEKTYKLNVRTVFKMRTNYRPLYLVVTAAEITLKELQATIRTLLYTRVMWERHVNRKVITQCHRCQDWGHATSNCNHAPRCVKCAKEHLTSTCSKTSNTPATCANCGGDHPANYTDCPAYIRKIEFIGKRNPNILQRYAQFKQMREARASGDINTAVQYMAAPTPAVNAWSRGAEKQHTSLNISCSERFPALPPLPQRRAPAERPSLNQPTPYPASTSASQPQPTPLPYSTHAPTSAPFNTAQTTRTITELSSELKSLNSLINLRNLLKFVRDMNVEICKCNDSQSRALIAIEFITERIDSYSI